MPGSPRDYADKSLPLREFSISDSRLIGSLAAEIDRFVAGGGRNPVLMTIHYSCGTLDELRVRAGADFGALLMSGYGSEIRVEDPNFSRGELDRLALDIMQAARLRFYKTEFIACPSCGRTLFDLQSTLREVKEAVSALGIEGLKIGVMGCIVNGPGEMADADYGYVGAGP
ncbi:MAG: flavodoxin-dependent (E)-4-hydroxy-3-methylbut-2-enyl-diphosphate synthase, partial [Muribaculaceae bacterium]|nr:flavodoxin-dependent (E)-4-hydroxy-3-methylbut-2-enyl-diphosphate synthase [Muribaculaceae bacterium]